jgi:hypothetical protein
MERKLHQRTSPLFSTLGRLSGSIVGRRSVGRAALAIVVVGTSVGVRVVIRAIPECVSNAL